MCRVYRALPMSGTPSFLPSFRYFQISRIRSSIRIASDLKIQDVYNMYVYFFSNFAVSFECPIFGKSLRLWILTFRCRMRHLLLLIGLSLCAHLSLGTAEREQMAPWVCYGSTLGKQNPNWGDFESSHFYVVYPISINFMNPKWGWFTFNFTSLA